MLFACLAAWLLLLSILALSASPPRRCKGRRLPIHPRLPLLLPWMHLPRHTLSSHIVAPAFVSATFSPCYAGPSSSEASSSASAASSHASRSAPSSYHATRAPSNGPSSGGGSGSAPPKSHLFACATRSGFLVAQTCPLKVVATQSESGVR